MTARSGHEQSLKSVAIMMPECESHQQFGTKGILDFFRSRRKSGGHLATVGFTTMDNELEKPEQSKNKYGIIRKRSNSIQTNDSISMSNLVSNSQPLRVAVTKRELVRRMSLSPNDTTTPMSQLLSGHIGGSESSTVSSGKIGPDEFMEMYRNRRMSLDSAYASNALAKLKQKKASEVKPPSSPRAFRDRALLAKPAGTTSLESKPVNVPRHQKATVFDNQEVSKSRRLSMFSPPPPEHLEEGRVKSLGLRTRHRRFSEPQGVDIEQLKKLSAMHPKLSQQDNVSDTMSNFPKYTPKIHRNVLPSVNLGNCLGQQLHMEPTHYVIWKEGKKIERILKLPCTDEECLEPIHDLGGTNENQTFVKFLRSHKCYELMPSSAKLVILDSQLKVTTAFEALTFHGIRSAPVWDEDTRKFVGMLTVTDFIQILKRFHGHEDELCLICDEKISEWRHILSDDLKPLVTVDSDLSLFHAVKHLHQDSIHRVLVCDEFSNDALYILTNRRIIHFVWYCFQMLCLPVPEFMNKSIKELGVGVYSDLAYVHLSTPLIKALDILLERRLSVVPVLDDRGHVVNLYGKFDVMNLVRNETYNHLNRTVAEELNYERMGFEGLFICMINDSLGTVIDRLIRADVHRLIVIDESRCLKGVVSISDIINFLILQQSYEDCIPTHDEEIDLNSTF